MVRFEIRVRRLGPRLLVTLGCVSLPLIGGYRDGCSVFTRAKLTSKNCEIDFGSYFDIYFFALIKLGEKMNKEF